MADYRDIWSPAKVFSPSTTRLQSQSAKDWTYVDQWLHTRYHPHPVPPFERTPDTLKALLALAATNESADDEHALSKKVKERALSQLQKRDADTAAEPENVLAALEEQLTPEGQRALNSIALLSVALGATDTAATGLAQRLIALTKEEFALAQQSHRLASLHTRLQADLEKLNAQILRCERGKEYVIPPELAGQVAEWTRATRHLQHKNEDYKERVSDLQGEFENTRAAAGVTVEALIEQEKAVLALKEHVLNLEAQARGFQGLPPEKDLARLEVERASRELAELEEKREALYDNMVGG